MSSRIDREKQEITEACSPLLHHSMNQRKMGRTIAGEIRLEEPLKVRRARERRERVGLEKELVRDNAFGRANQAVLEAEERQLDVLFADALGRLDEEVVVGTIESSSGFVHEIGLLDLTEN